MSSSSGSVYSFNGEEKADLYDVESIGSIESFATNLTRQSTISTYTKLPDISICARILSYCIPSTRLFPRRERITQEKLHPTAYLDGMRGFAAFAVFLCHLSYGTWDIAHVYGAGEEGKSSENTWLLQLPIVRLIYSGPPMVAIFFVISGYALSYKPLRLMRARKHDDLFNAMTSSVFRRAIRLFLPCFVSTFIVAALAQLGFYKMTEEFAYDMRAVIEGHAPSLDNPMLQFSDWATKMLQSINVFDWALFAGSIDLDRHLWTIPVEFRCSLALFLTHLLVARMSSKLRISTLAFLVVWGFYWDRWDMIPFWCGCAIAELDLIKASKETSSKEGDSALGEERQRCSSLRSTWLTALRLTVLFTALFLASYPDMDGHITPGYKALTRLIPNGFTEKHRFWPTIAAGMIIWCASNLECIKAIFNSSLMQYFGKISFPLYVCHGFVIHTLGYMLMERAEEITGQEDRFRFEVGYLVAAVITILATIWTADIFLRVVDVRCVTFARWLEAKFFD